MHIAPALLAFANDPSAIAGAQGRMHAAKALWQRRPEVARVLSDCRAWARGVAFEDCAHLAALMTGQGAADFVDGWLSEMTAACSDVPLAQLAFRHSQADGVRAIQLHRAGRMTLSVMMIDPKERATPAAVSFTDCHRRELVLAGAGQAVAYRHRDDAAPTRRPFSLAPGVQFEGDRDRSRAVVAVTAPLVFLRAACEPAQPGLTREVEIATGRIIHRASACPAESRAELAAALLGAMERGDAAKALASYACGQAGEGARWQALRHAIALDTAAGFAGLCRIAQRSDDPISPEASALCESLCTSYPQLANMREGQWLAS